MRARRGCRLLLSGHGPRSGSTALASLFGAEPCWIPGGGETGSFVLSHRGSHFRVHVLFDLFCFRSFCFLWLFVRSSSCGVCPTACVHHLLRVSPPVPVLAGLTICVWSYPYVCPIIRGWFDSFYALVGNLHLYFDASSPQFLSPMRSLLDREGKMRGRSTGDRNLTRAIFTRRFWAPRF